MKALGLVVVVACSAPATRPPATNTAVDKPPPQLLEAPKPIDRERIHFEADRAILQPPELAQLDRVVAGMKADPALLLQVSGHADASEADATLGYARATAVRQYLMRHGIAERRLLFRDVGTKEPRGDASANRRVEFERVTIKINSVGGRVVITDTDVEIVDPITFEPGTVTLRRSSFPALDAVVATLQGNPSIQLIEIQSHVGEKGDDTANLRLTEARAIIVKKYLVAKGVDPARLTTQGYGETQPIARGHDDASQAKNTRIAFLIVKRTP